MFYSLAKGEGFVENEFARQTYFVLRSFTYNAHAISSFADHTGQKLNLTPNPQNNI